MILLLLLLTAERSYPSVPLEKLKDWTRPRAEVCGPVVYVRKQEDGDLHVTLSNGRAKVVIEQIPIIPLPRPKKGQLLRVRGIVRFDKGHRWAEIHPAEWWEVVPKC